MVVAPSGLLLVYCLSLGIRVPARRAVFAAAAAAGWRFTITFALPFSALKSCPVAPTLPLPLPLDGVFLTIGILSGRHLGEAVRFERPARLKYLPIILQIAPPAIAGCGAAWVPRLRTEHAKQLPAA